MKNAIRSTQIKYVQNAGNVGGLWELPNWYFADPKVRTPEPKSTRKRRNRFVHNDKLWKGLLHKMQVIDSGDVIRPWLMPNHDRVDYFAASVKKRWANVMTPDQSYTPPEHNTQVKQLLGSDFIMPTPVFNPHNENRPPPLSKRIWQKSRTRSLGSTSHCYKSWMGEETRSSKIKLNTPFHNPKFSTPHDTINKDSPEFWGQFIKKNKHLKETKPRKLSDPITVVVKYIILSMKISI